MTRRQFRTTLLLFGVSITGLLQGAMRNKVLISLLLFSAAVAVARLWWASFQRPALRLSVQFVGYISSSSGAHIGVVQISNASSFAVVRGRSPEIRFESSSARVEYAPTGWKVLQPRECETVQTEPLTNGLRWRLIAVGERLGSDSYGIGSESAVRVRVRQAAMWFQDHGILAPLPKQTSAVLFSSDWIEP